MTDGYLPTKNSCGSPLRVGDRGTLRYFPSTVATETCQWNIRPRPDTSNVLGDFFVLLTILLVKRNASSDAVGRNENGEFFMLPDRTLLNLNSVTPPNDENETNPIYVRYSKAENCKSVVSDKVSELSNSNQTSIKKVIDFQVALQLKYGWQVEIKWAFIHCDGSKRIGSLDEENSIIKKQTPGVLAQPRLHGGGSFKKCEDSTGDVGEFEINQKQCHMSFQPATKFQRGFVMVVEISSTVYSRVSNNENNFVMLPNEEVILMATVSGRKLFRISTNENCKSTSTDDFSEKILHSENLVFVLQSNSFYKFKYFFVGCDNSVSDKETISTSSINLTKLLTVIFGSVSIGLLLLVLLCIKVTMRHKNTSKPPPDLQAANQNSLSQDDSAATGGGEKGKIPSLKLKPSEIRSGCLYDSTYETVKSQGHMTENVAYQSTMGRDYRVA